jgi:hypothetical protein
MEQRLSGGAIIFAAEYHSATRNARSVFHRLGWPTLSPVSINILPGY